MDFWYQVVGFKFNDEKKKRRQKVFFYEYYYYVPVHDMYEYRNFISIKIHIHFVQLSEKNTALIWLVLYCS